MRPTIKEKPLSNIVFMLIVVALMMFIFIMNPFIGVLVIGIMTYKIVKKNKKTKLHFK